VKPGQTAQILIALQNDDPAEETEYSLNVTDLISPSGSNIPASAVHINPSQKTIAPDGSVDVQIKINIPADTSPGIYTGPLELIGLDYPGAVLVVLVTT